MVTLLGEEFILSKKEIIQLLNLVADEFKRSVEDITVKCVSAQEITNLNLQYRKKSESTNVLSFSYDEGVHDVAICMEVAEIEARELKIDLKYYSAWLLVHAFIHAYGLDHEISRETAKQVEEMESRLLDMAGYSKN